MSRPQYLALRHFSPAFVLSDGLCGLPEEKEEIEDVRCSDVEQNVESIRKGESRPVEHACKLKAAQQETLIGFEPEEDKGIQKKSKRQSLPIHQLYIL